MFTIREELLTDIVARERLLDAAFGEARLEKTSERLREGRKPADGLAFVLEHDGALVGTVRLWHVAAGPGRPALLLGPIAIACRFQGLGLGGKLMREALTRAKALGHAAVLLVGDASYYARFGFSAEKTGALRLPGPYERDRFLALELTPGALRGAHGLVAAAGASAHDAGDTALVPAANDTGLAPARAA